MTIRPAHTTTAAGARLLATDRGSSQPVSRPLPRQPDWRARVLLVVLVLLGGCGGGDDRAARRTPTVQPLPPKPLLECGSDAARWRRVPGAPAGTQAVERGNGPTVVFANDSGNDACGWLPLASSVAAAGRRVVLFSYANVAPPAEPAMVRDALALAGAGPSALVGASLGGRVVIEAAARRPVGLRGIVSLSSEREIDYYHDILRAARRVRVPLLYVGSRKDVLTDGARQPRQLHAATGGRLVLVRGSAHGVDLLDVPTRAQIEAFLGRVLA
jgi:pimeloyl-ACP methyl ester carboxylesterase